VFLSQVFNPVMVHLKKGAKGLDFGCGPGPTLSLMFEKQGYQVSANNLNNEHLGLDNKALYFEIDTMDKA
jgi:cyclopropane fatty-acyl-phospholipid synthase-like methyltransferase